MRGLARALGLAMAVCQVAVAAPTPPRYALFRLDPLGLAPEIVEQLESILRIEIARAVNGTLPSRAEVQAVIDTDPKLAACTGDPACLAPLAKKLGVDRLVAGTVAGLAESYVVDLRLVDVNGSERGRVRATLAGRPDELIQEVRVAACRLLSPEKLRGAISLLSEVANAEVLVDGRSVGRTPLLAPVADLTIGDHVLRVTRAGWSDFEERVPVRYEKATEVVVRQRAVSIEARIEDAERRSPAPVEPPYWSRWWFWTAVGGTAIGGGLIVGGLAAPHQDVVR